MADIHTLDIARQRDDELLSRLIDGECSHDERVDLELRLVTDADLRARLEEFRSNDAYFRSVLAAQDNSVKGAIADRSRLQPKRRPPLLWHIQICSCSESGARNCRSDD